MNHDKIFKTLGKAIAVLLLPIVLTANISISTDRPSATKGDIVALTIKATGSDIKLPDIKSILSSPVIGTSSSVSTSISNSGMTTTKSKIYQFVANQSGDIGPYDVQINGKTEQTDTVRLKVGKPKASTIDDDLFATATASQTDLYVGEEMVVDIVFRYKEHLNIRRIQIDELTKNEFAIKRLKSTKPIKENGYITYKESYLVSPMREGEFEIPPHKVSVGIDSMQSDFFGIPLLKWQKIYSNALAIKVSALPQDATVIGDFEISATVDKTQTKPNRPVNILINITGSGNMEDIDQFKLEIDNVSVFSEAPSVRRGKNGDVWTQKFSAVSDENFHIPPMKLRFFHKPTKKIKTIKTKAFDIKVVGKTEAKPKLQEKAKKPKKAKKKQKRTMSSGADRYIYGAGGLLLGGLLVLVYFRQKNKKTPPKDTDIDIAIKKSKTDKELYKVLSRLENAKAISDIIDKLEQNIYKDKKHSIDKNYIIERLKKRHDEYLYS